MLSWQWLLFLLYMIHKYHYVSNPVLVKTSYEQDVFVNNICHRRYNKVHVKQLDMCWWNTNAPAATKSKYGKIFKSYM